MNIQGAEPYLIAYLELDTLVLGIVILGLLVLGSFNKLREILMEIFNTFGHLFGCGNRILVELLEIDCEAGIEAIISIKWRTRMLGIVIREFSERQELGPIVLLMIAVYSEILLDGLIHTFSLSIGLWVKCSRHALLQIESLGQLGPKLRPENRSAI